MPRPQLRRRGIRSRQYNHGRADSHTAVKVLNVLVSQTNATGGNEAADGRWLIGAVDPIFGVAEIHRTGAEWICFAAGHEARQVRLALDHLLGREPVRPFLHAADVLGARPGEALAADTNAVANGLAVADCQVKVGVRRIDDDGSGRLDCGVVDHGAMKPRRYLFGRPSLRLIFWRQSSNLNARIL
jgi:hypothetical protein